MEDTDTKFSEAPPLPRYPTVIANTMPRPVDNEFEEDPALVPLDPSIADGSPTHLIAPPRFPSLVDVDVTKATAVAAAQAEPLSAPDLEGAISHATLAPPSTSASAVREDDSDLLFPSSPPPPSEPIGRQLEQEIMESIKRGKVDPGTGARRASAAASKQWSSMDQRHLNALLREAGGQMPSPEHKRKPSIDTFPTSSIAARIAALNKAADEDPTVPTPDNSLSAPKGLAAAAYLGSTPSAVNVDQDILPESHETGDTLAEPIAQVSMDDRKSPERPIKTPYGVIRPEDDVPILGSPTRTAPARAPQKGRAVTSPPPTFPSALATVPMTVFSGPGAEEQVEEMAYTESDLSTRHEVMVRSKSTSARVNITGDFGLKNGHEGVVRDAAFFDNDTLLTAGEDGKVCIWDLEEKFVKSQFLPYNGNPVQMIKPIVEEDGSATRSLITLSDDRLMRIWNLVDNQAVLLRSMQIPASNRDLVMSIPVLTPQMKAHAAATAAAAAVAATDLSESAPPSLDLAALQAQTLAASRPQVPAAQAHSASHVTETEGSTGAPSGGSKPFSFQGNIFSKGRKTSAKKAVAS